MPLTHHHPGRGVREGTGLGCRPVAIGAGCYRFVQTGWVVAMWSVE